MRRLVAIVLFCVLVPCAYGKTINYANGSKYVGEVSNGVPHGQGTHTWANGEKYVGEFKDNRYHGQGTWTHPDGTTSVGEFKADNPWNVTLYDKDGEIIATISDGVWTEK
jgi:hypothetical protein